MSIDAIRGVWLANIRKAVDASFDEHTEHRALFCASVMRGVLDDLDAATHERDAALGRVEALEDYVVRIGWPQRESE